MWLAQMPGLLSDAALEAAQRQVLGATPARMVREMADALDTFTQDHALVLILEDLHWSDVATLDLLAALAQRRGPARLLVLGTYRPVDVIVHQHPLKALTQALAIHDQCMELPLELLTRRRSRSISPPGVARRSRWPRPSRAWRGHCISARMAIHSFW